ncbi:MAG TPA: polyprenyl synthetase family protein, partial [Polyangia bacterium]|nr:polyprenyl synthetase family protein [Polyangia bacterium]
MFDLDGYLTERRAVVEAALARHLDACAAAPVTLRDALAYSLLAGGKRLRPMLALAACEAVGGRVDDALDAACAVEFIHTYSLIHDDLPAMDDDDFRRGRPTAHKKFGEAVAILSGDALAAEAFRVAASNRAGREAAVAEVVFELARASGAVGMVGGQVIDIEATGKK